MTGPYQAHDASAENGGAPVFNVKGPGYDALVQRWHAHAANHAAVRKLAEDRAADLNLAYREGVKAGREGK